MIATPAATPRSRLGLEILAVALGLGLMGDALLRAVPWGVNVTLCTSLLVGAGVFLVRRHRLAPGPDAPWLALTALLLGAAFARRDAEILATFDGFALLFTLGLAAASLQGARIATLGPLDYLRAEAIGFAHTISGGVVLVGQDIEWRHLPRGRRLSAARSAGLGALLAVPLLLVFGSLFASADRVFGNVLANLFAFDPGAVASHTLLFALWGALAAGYLRWALIARPAASPVQPPGVRLGIVPVGTALGLLTLLFLVFVVIQLRYFFGGAELVEQTTGLTYAEYARHGFFELVTASSLLLPVLFGADHLVRGETPADVAVFRRLAGLLLVLLAVVMASALERMRLYVQAFGLSEIRLYATAFMIYLLGVFGWLGATVLRGRRHKFAFGALIQAYALLAGLHVLNPDALIVRRNLARPATERPFDARYAASLGADAVPPLLDALPSLGDRERCVVAERLLRRWGSGESGDATDWRTWNWSRSRARRLVGERAAELRAIPCPRSKETS